MPAPQHVEIDYTNWRGERRWRRVFPLALEWGTSPFHPDAQWLLLALDLDKGEERNFTMSSIHAWRVPS